MRVDVERYGTNEVYLLKDGSYIVVVDIEPFNGEAKDYGRRRVSYIMGSKHSKETMFNNGFPVEIGDINTIIDFSLKKEQVTTVSILDGKIATYLGKLNKNTAQKFGKSLSDMY